MKSIRKFILTGHWSIENPIKIILSIQEPQLFRDWFVGEISAYLWWLWHRLVVEWIFQFRDWIIEEVDVNSEGKYCRHPVFSTLANLATAKFINQAAELQMILDPLYIYCSLVQQLISKWSKILPLPPNFSPNWRSKSLEDKLHTRATCGRNHLLK